MLEVPNKTEDLNLSVLNMIARIKKSKILAKHISCECKHKFDGRKCNSNQWWNINKCQCECRKYHISEKIMFGILHATCSCENGKYLASIMDNSARICDEDTESYDEEIKTILTNV